MNPDPSQSPGGVADALVTLRQFVGGLNAVLNDQTYAGQDGSVYNPSRQFATVGPYGTAIEGQAVGVTPGGGVRLSPGMTMMLLGAAAFWLFTKHAG